MFYVNINKLPIAITDLPICTRCPICKKEFRVPEFFEMLENAHSDPHDDLLDDNASMFCDECAREFTAFKQILSAHVPESQLDKAVMKAMENLHSSVTA